MSRSTEQLEGDVEARIQALLARRRALNVSGQAGEDIENIRAAFTAFTGIDEEKMNDSTNADRVAAEQAIADAAAEKVRAAAPLILEALRMCVAVLHNTDCSTGYCCCGSKVDMHFVGDGHAPVDEGAYYQHEAIDAARKAIDAALN